MALKVQYSTETIDPDKFPELARFHKIMEDMRGEETAPKWSDFHFNKIPVDLIPSVFITDVIQEPLNFRYRFIGTRIVSKEGKDFTGWCVDDVPFADNDSFSARSHYELFLSNPVPTFFVVQETGRFSTVVTILTGLRFPILNEDGSLDKVIGILQFGGNTKNENEYIQELFAEDKYFQLADL